MVEAIPVLTSVGLQPASRYELHSWEKGCAAVLSRKHAARTFSKQRPKIIPA
jgi:hypothetical protein